MALSRSRTVAAAMLMVALALAVGSTAVLAPEADARVSISSVTVIDGAVLASHCGADFTQAREGDVLVAGDTIRTETGGAAEITYFDGSSVRLESNAELVVEGVRTSNGGAAQTLGRAWHVITKIFSGGSRYEVRTPSSTASVRG